MTVGENRDFQTRAMNLITPTSAAGSSTASHSPDMPPAQGRTTPPLILSIIRTEVVERWMWKDERMEKTTQRVRSRYACDLGKMWHANMYRRVEDRVDSLVDIVRAL